MILKAEAFYSLPRLPETSFYSKEPTGFFQFYIPPRSLILLLETFNSFIHSCSTHPCIFKTFQGIPDILQGFTLIQYSSIRMYILPLTGFQKTPQSTSWETSNILQTFKSSKIGRCCILANCDYMQSEIRNVLTIIHSFTSRQWMTQRQCVYELSHWHNTQLICVKHIKSSWVTISSIRISYPAECNCHLLLWKTSESFSYLLLSIQTSVYKPM